MISSKKGNLSISSKIDQYHIEKTRVGFLAFKKGKFSSMEPNKGMISANKKNVSICSKIDQYLASKRCKFSLMEPDKHISIILYVSPS